MEWMIGFKELGIINKHIYIYIYIERERERERGRKREHLFD